MISKTFVGRNTELTQIREWLEKSASGLVWITGAGGIGKTSLLRRIADQYSADERYIVEYFDLAEQPMKITNQALHLADSLGRENFPEFMRKLTELDTAPRQQTIGGLEEDAINACVQEVAAYLKSKKKKLLRITDTFEIALKYILYEDNWAGGINEKLRDVTDTIFITAGRDKVDEKDVLETIHPLLKNSFGDEKILHVPLSGFNKIEMDEFFAECDPHRMIPLEMREKLQLLTEGRPILLSLAVEWLQNEIPFPIMIEKDLPELREIVQSENEQKRLLGEFEFQLVSKVRELQGPLEIASLYMAHIDRRMDSRLLSVLLDIDDKKAERYLQELIKLPFVKEYIGSKPQKCTLHDEMRELVKRHAWQYLDINGAERNRLTRKVVEQYYIPRVDLLKQKKTDMVTVSHTNLLRDTQAGRVDQERWLLEAETVYYYSKLGEKEAFAFFDLAFYDKEDSYIRDQFLLDELKRAGMDKEKILLREADGLRRRGQIDEARKICSTLIEKGGLGIDERIHVYTSLGAMDENNPVIAEASYIKALDLAASINDQRVQAILHNNLGRLFRNISRLEDSIQHFNQALIFSQNSGNRDSGGTIRNNLAWTHRLNGNLDEADVLCRLSMAENRKRGLERPLAYAYLTKADIERDKNNLPNAGKYVKLALDIFNRLDDDDGKAQAYRTQANISRYLHNFDQALDSLKEGIQLAEGNNSLSVLASLYQLFGRTYRHYATFLRDERTSGGSDRTMDESKFYNEARKALLKSIDISQKIGNPWEVARSQLEIALVMMLSQASCNETELNDLLDQVWQTASELDDNLLKVYVCENRARLAQRKEDYAGAGHAIGEAAYYISKRTGVETQRAFARFHNFLLNPDISSEQSYALAKGTKDQLQSQEYNDRMDYPKLVALINLCEQVLDLNNIGSGL
jgi:tetratricopeptide (TPR) repeat protein